VIALDTSSLIAFFAGSRGPDVDAIDVALEHHQAVLPPVVLSEVLSDPRLRRDVRDAFLALPMLDIVDGYWERAGLLRAKLIARGRRARLADTLVAQSCLDHDVGLVTRDGDFEAFARLAGLRLLAGRGTR
jgi:predicted nucleic acid-binding protein